MKDMGKVGMILDIKIIRRDNGIMLSYTITIYRENSQQIWSL